MGDKAKPYSAGDVPDEMTCTDCGEPDCCLMEEQSRIIATAEALEKAEADLVESQRNGALESIARKKAEAERDALYAALSEAGISHGGTVEGLRQGLSVVARLKAERDEWRQRCLGPVDDAEASRVIESIQDVAKREVVVRLVRERDEARAELASISQEFGLPPTIRPVEGEIRRMLDGWREARAEVARLQDLHTRCAAFDDQPGPSCVALAAKCAALREALVVALKQGWYGIHSSLCYSGEPYTGCTCPPWVQQARAALAGTSDKEGR